MCDPSTLRVFAHSNIVIIIKIIIVHVIIIIIIINIILLLLLLLLLSLLLLLILSLCMFVNNCFIVMRGGTWHGTHKVKQEKCNKQSSWIKHLRWQLRTDASVRICFFIIWNMDTFLMRLIIIQTFNSLSNGWHLSAWVSSWSPC